MAKRRVEFWYEFASTYSYLAALRIEQRAAAAGIGLVWRPFLLGPIFAEQGWGDSPFNIYPAKGAYMWRDMERLCAAYALPWRRPSVFPRSGLTAARVALALADTTFVPVFSKAVFTANFVEDRDIADPLVIAEILAKLGLPAEALERAKGDEIKARLRTQTEEAKKLGIFGAPSFVVDGELFWGNDRLAQALDWPAA